MKKVRSQEGQGARIALYVRVSTDRQAEEGYSIEVQKERLLAFTKTMDMPTSVEFYVDDGFTGATLDRPAMGKLILDAQSGMITHVCVYKLDRLSRSQKDTLHLIEDVFLPNNIAFISVQESFNTATAFGRAVVGILSVFAQLERENIYERTRSGMQKRVEQGFWPGGGGVPFGYDYDSEQGILVPNEDADTVQKIYELYLSGYSLQSIANLLGLKYEKLAAQILSRKTNTGIIEYNGVEYEGKHKPIVSREIFDRAMEMKDRRSRDRLAPATEHLLTGLIYCGVCGAKMRYQKWGDKGHKLVCYSRQRSKPYLVRDPNCENETVWARDVEAAVVEDLFSMTPQKIEVDGESSVTPQEMLEKKRAAQQTKLRRLYELYAENGNEVLLKAVKEAEQELSRLDKAVDREKQGKGISESARAAREELKSVKKAWPYMELREKRSLICSLVEKITVTHGTVTIEYRI